MISLSRTSQSQQELHLQGTAQQPDEVSSNEKKRRSRRRGRAPSLARMCVSRTRRSVSVDSAEFDLDVSEAPSISCCHPRSMSQERLGGGSQPSGAVSEGGTGVDLFTELQEKTRAIENMAADILSSGLKEDKKDAYAPPLVFGCGGNKETLVSQQEENIVEMSAEGAHAKQNVSSVKLKIPSVTSTPAFDEPAKSQLLPKVQPFGLDNTDSYSLNPPISTRRSNSFDHATPWPSVSTPEDILSTGQVDICGASSLTVPKPAGLFRRASWEIPKICLHCMHLETLAAEEKNRDASAPGSENVLDKDEDLSSPCSEESLTSTSSSDDEEEIFDKTKDSPGADPVVRFTLEGPEDNDEAMDSGQTDASPSFNLTKSDAETPNFNNFIETGRSEKSVSAMTPGGKFEQSSSFPSSNYTDVVSLAVPVVKQRSTSMDAACLLSPPGEGSVGSPGRQARSRSVDANVSRKTSNTLAILALVHQSFK
ncbi:hypothetical protein ElyMa_006441600 [Elysia marginata]|uniref:Uncharacterized protein n=1 Tax=Elysia marginata TaxID=1093978 RepID=A0AAV4HWG4_9GAST|nr:hypothetical protein ElyMa_006441600 [Elysia marginata]